MQASALDECDGGGAAGGDAGGGGAAVGGDAGAAAASLDSGDTSGEMAGTSTAEVLGTNEPGKGFFGKDNFYIPSRVKVPLYRWEVANGGSKRKKGKNGKPKKTPYEKDMKVVVSMFEDEGGASDSSSTLLPCLKVVSSGIKTLDDVIAVKNKLFKDMDNALERVDKAGSVEAREAFSRIGNFIDDIASSSGEQVEEMWPAVQLASGLLVCLLSPTDIIAELFPSVGTTDYIKALSAVDNVIKDDIDSWNRKQSARSASKDTAFES